MPLRAVVLTFDRLHLGYLGCYGNDWIETPNFDRLATQSVVFDQHFAVDLRAQSASQGWWPEPRRLDETTGESHGKTALPGILSASGVKTWLFDESDGSDAQSIAPAFDEIITVRGADSLESGEDEPPFARLVQKVAERLPEITSANEPGLVWLKSRGVPAPWLPPHPFADLYLDEFGLDAEVDDEGDEAVPVDEQSAVVPAGAKQGDTALVELKYARALYAAYVTWLDRWLGKLLRELESSAGFEEMLLIVTAARGQSIGERGVLDEQATPLRAELIHTPLFVRLPDRRHDATRRALLTQATDLGPTLLDWFGLSIPAPESAASITNMARSLLPIVRNEADVLRDFVFVEGPEERGVRSRSALYVQQRSKKGRSIDALEGLLFEKPSDRWDMADVASQDPGECERLQQLLSAE